MIKKVNRRKMNESYGVYDLINYFDVWGNEEDGWDVNDVSRDETDIYIDDDASDEEIVDYLIDKVGFLSPSARGKVEVWNDGGMIEFSVAETGEPLGRLERKRTVNGKSFGESKRESIRNKKSKKIKIRESEQDDMAVNQKCKYTLIMNGPIGNLSPKMEFDNLKDAVEYAKTCDIYTFYHIKDENGNVVKRGRCNTKRIRESVINESDTRANDVYILSNALSDIVDAFKKCAESFDEVDADFLNDIISPKYPFNKSFDELVYDVLLWKKDCDKRISGEWLSFDESFKRNKNK